MDTDLWDIGMKAIRALEVDRGILASGKEELYGCVFGRDSLITSMLLLHVYENTQDAYFITLVRKILVNLAKLQGRETNRESGEEPGKIIHEFRPENHEHLTKNLEHPWYLYPDGVMRNYDTVDATPLFLMTVEKYYRLSNDEGILELLKANVHDALAWLISNIESSHYGFVEYQFHVDRTFGGLRVQSWMDSSESAFFEDSDDQPTYPIAPVEVQAYTYKAFKVWSVLLREHDAGFASSLRERAGELKENFAKSFVGTSAEEIVAFAVDGENRPLSSPRSSMGHCLWASLVDEEGNFDSILPDSVVQNVARRLMEPDLFVPEAGIRTLSSKSKHFEANSYHNGSIWPHDTAIVAEGLQKAGYVAEAKKIREALLKAYTHFGTPLELFAYDDVQGIFEYQSPGGQGACRLQAWSAGALLSILSEDK